MFVDGKAVVITGATRGIGFETAKKFLLDGAKVAVLGSKPETVENAVSKLKEENKDFQVEGFCPNLTDESEVSNCFEKIKSIFGKIDVLINNAGISSKTHLEDFSPEEFDRISNLNIKAVYVCSKAVLPYLKETKGVILNTSSMVSVYGQPSGFMYPASKFAVNGITKSLSRELAPFGIRVNAVAPGITETDMVSALPKEMIEPLIKTIPLGRIGKPEDIANAFLFLASSMASYITGDILHVDGAARA